MKISPLEIKQKTFSTKTFSKGYDREEVASFLLLLAQEWELLQDENKEQKIRIDMLEKEVSKLKEVESSLFRTLKTAEDTSTNIVEQARKTAELKVQEAQNKADFILNDARLQAKEIVQKAQIRARNTIDEMILEMKGKERLYKELETYRDNFLLELRSFMNESLEKLQRFEAKHPDNYFEDKIKSAEDYLEDRNQHVDQQNFALAQEVNQFQISHDSVTLAEVINEPESNATFSNFEPLQETSSFFDTENLNA
jgi:cell division initiation protein